MSAFQIPAFLKGVVEVANVVANEVHSPWTKCMGIRPGSNGAPRGAYKGGEWYFGVFFQGMRGADGGSLEAYTANMGVGIDITRILSRMPTAKQGDLILPDGELFERIGRLTEVLMQGESVVARACNAQYTAMATAAGKPVDGIYRELFNTFTVSPIRTESAEWIAADPEKTPTVFVCSLTFTGIKFYKLLQELTS